jgi:hypothetical protein
MISINFSIRNPRSNEFSNLWNRAYCTPFKNKFIELEVTKDSVLVSFMFNWTVRQSHAGVDLGLGMFGYNIHCQFYDNRHWNHTEGRWMKYTEDLGEH